MFSHKIIQTLGGDGPCGITTIPLKSKVETLDVSGGGDTFGTFIVRYSCDKDIIAFIKYANRQASGRV